MGHANLVAGLVRVLILESDFNVNIDAIGDIERLVLIVSQFNVYNIDVVHHFVEGCFKPHTSVVSVPKSLVDWNYSE